MKHNPKLVEVDPTGDGTTLSTEVTLRDLFAAFALAGFCTAAKGDYSTGACNEVLVERAFVLAGRMLAARERTP